MLLPLLMNIWDFEVFEVTIETRRIGTATRVEVTASTLDPLDSRWFYWFREGQFYTRSQSPWIDIGILDLQWEMKCVESRQRVPGNLIVPPASPPRAAAFGTTDQPLGAQRLLYWIRSTSADAVQYEVKGEDSFAGTPQETWAIVPQHNQWQHFFITPALNDVFDSAAPAGGGYGIEVTAFDDVGNESIAASIVEIIVRRPDAPIFNFVFNSAPPNNTLTIDLAA